MLNTIWLYTVRTYIHIGLFFYFKNIHIVNIGEIPKNKPVLILANHQNALLDALIIAVKCKHFSYFLTRASAFNSKIIAKLLHGLRMFPVYRMRDGIQTIKKNNEIFKTCTNLLNENQVVVIFPEGDHNLKRTVRPLSKGFTRLVFDTLEMNPNSNLQLLPIGFNYVHAEKFVDEVCLHIGKPIQANDYITFERNESVLKLKKVVHQSLSKLTTHIPNDDYEDALKKLETLNVNFLKPESVNSCITHNFVNCKIQKRKKQSFIKQLLKGLLIINLVIPYLIWKLLIQPKIEEDEFVSTFRFAVAITLVPIYLLVIVYVLSFFIGWFLTLIYLLAVLLLELIVVKF